MQRFLVIGIGGSGGQVLRHTWNEVLLRLKATPGGWTGGMPECWQFLHIDVPENPDGLEDPAVPRALLDDTRYLGLAKSPREMRHYFEVLTQPTGHVHASADWHPNANVVAEPWKGAGQRRLAGHMIATVELRRIRDKIVEVANRLLTDQAQSDLQVVSRALGNTSPTLRNPAPRVVVVSSLSGGSGSGTFLDIAEVLRTSAVDGLQWLRNSIGIFLAPNVFRFSGQKAGLEPNALAAISELISAYVDEGEYDGDDATLLQRGSGAAPLTGRRAPEWNFLVGRSNGDTTFDNEREVCGALAKCLTTIFTDAVVLDNFDSKVLTNWDGPATQVPIVDTSSARTHEKNPFSALGYASVGLGRTRFAQYSAERLSRRAVEQLLEGHLRHQDPDRPLSGEALVSAIADQYEERFFEASGVWEEDADGQKHDQILDALRDRAAVRARLDEIKRELSTGMAKGDAKRRFSPSQWMDILIQRVHEKRLEFSQEERTQRLQNAQRWAGSIQAQLLDETAKAVGIVGIPVTIELLHRLGAQLERGAKGLQREREDRLLPEAMRALDSVKSFFSDLRDKVITGAHSSVEQGAAKGTVSVGLRSEADVYELAAQLMVDLRQGFVTPLARALLAAGDDLEQIRDGNERGAALINSWSARSVPERLMPAKNEVLLDPPTQYPSALDDLLVSTFRESDDVSPGGSEGAEARAVAEIISGAWARSAADSSVPHQDLVAVKQYWQCASPDVNASGPPQRASFSIDVDPEVLLANADGWVRQRPGSLSEFVGMSLGDDLASADTRRKHAFVDGVSRALSLSRPFVTISDDGMRTFHGHDAGVELTRIITPLPVGSDHSARGDLESVLVNIGHVDQSYLNSCFDPTMSGDSVGFMSFITGSLQPFVLSSLTSPILQEWNQCAHDKGARQGFWQYRRTRNLADFVPAAPAVKRALVRGFVTARTLGYLPDPGHGAGSEGLAIWTKGGWRNFPPHLLGGTPRRAGDALAPLLESFVLAFLGAGSGDPEWMAAYEAMLELGKEGHDVDDNYPATLAEYRSVNAALEHWVIKGEPVVGAPDPLPQLPGDGADARLDALREVLEQIRDAYIQLAPPEVLENGTVKADRRWGIRDLAVAAVNDVIEALDTTRTASDAMSGPIA